MEVESVKEWEVRAGTGTERESKEGDNMINGEITGIGRNRVLGKSQRVHRDEPTLDHWK